MQNYLREIIPADVDADEVIDAFLMHFGNGQFVNGKTASFGHSQGQVAVSITTNSSGAITAIHPGPHFDKKDVRALREKIETELILAGPLQIARAILFSTSKTGGTYLWKDEFQLLPVPEDRPQPDFACRDYPSVLEVSYVSSSNPHVNMKRSAKKLSEVELTLIPLLVPLVQMQAPRMHNKAWIEGPGKDTLWRQEHAQLGYRQIGGPEDRFTDTTGISPMPRMTYQDYYKDEGRRQDSFTIPDAMEGALTKVGQLSKGNKNKYLRSAYWLKQATINRYVSNSISFVSLVSAVEALIGPPERSDPCGTCRKPTGKGNTELFRDFIEEYFGENKAPKKLKSLFYEMRSDLTHGSNVFETDITWMSSGLKSGNESSRLYSLEYVVRILIYNWLQKNGAATPSVTAAYRFKYPTIRAV